MLKRLLCYSQYILPQHGISTIMGKMANAKNVWLKNKLIDSFCRHYQIDFSEAAIQDPHAYDSFNHFFTRELKTGVRPIIAGDHTIASPADGTIAALGTIQQQQLVQAKNMYFNATSLLGGQADLGALFEDGHYATIYLAPHNYHRVHMPVTGKLRQSVYIPGKLYSVNRMTSQLIPNLYARNERLALIFDTEMGPVAVIMVGALIVGSMQTVWMKEPKRSHQIEIDNPTNEIRLEKGAELGRFLLGSTVILLLPKSRLQWSETATTDCSVQTGQLICTLTPSVD